MRLPGGIEFLSSDGIAAARKALEDNPLTPEQVSNYIRARYASWPQYLSRGYGDPEKAADHERAFEWYKRIGTCHE